MLAKLLIYNWHPVRDSNPCCRRERIVITQKIKEIQHFLKATITKTPRTLIEHKEFWVHLNPIYYDTS